MANNLMFEVGIKSAQEQLDKIKKEFKEANGELSRLLNVKVSIDGVDALTRQLTQIGNSDGLRNLRKEIEMLNQEFSVLAKGAGGTGSMSSRVLDADIQKAMNSIDRYTTKLKELNEDRSKLPGGTRNSSWQRFTEEIMRYESSLEGARRKLEQLNEQKNKPVADESLKKTAQDAMTLETALGRVEAAIGGLKSGMNVNLSGDFANWAREVQAVTASVKELVEQLQKIKQGEQTTTSKGGLFDQQQFKTLQEAIDAVIKEVNRLKEAFAGIGEIRGISQLTDAINALFHNVNTFKDVFSTLSSAVNLTPTSEYVTRLKADFEAAQAKVQELTEKMQALAAAQTQVTETASKAGKSKAQIEDSQSAMYNRYQKLMADILNIEREALNLRNVLGGNNPLSDGLRDYIVALGRIRVEVKDITSAPKVEDAITKGMSSEKLSKLSAALANIKMQYKEVVADAKDFNKATEKGNSQAEARIRKLGMAFNELKNYMKANGGSEEMRRLQSEIQGAIQKMRQLMNAGKFGDAVNVYERLSGLIRQAASATKEFEHSQSSLSGSVSHVNSQLMGQSQILSDLKMMAYQYLSVWGAQTFLHNIIELGGQLEQQRLSIGAILQDTAQANHLFGQIKDLAIRSPFGVQQLDAMSKQLSAYGFQYSELYEWTKRLADISAATGTSVDRLALALGHVRAEGALSGYTLRQFSMGNIPLLQKLSENLGKTKQEIRKMTRAKEIGYEDVLEVLKQLTDEGGMFYEAQETMAQALNAKFKNLRDSFQIMYSEMAEGAPGDFLKGVATTLTELSKNWRILMPMLTAGIASFGIWKTATMAFNYEAAKTGVLMNGNAISTSKYSVAQLRAIATTGRFTFALKGLGRALASFGKFLFSPWTLGFAAVEGLIYLWSKHNEEVRKAEELTKSFSETADESMKNISKRLETIKPYSKAIDNSQLKTGVDTMTEAIKNYGIDKQKILDTAFAKDDQGNVMELPDKYKYLRSELEKTADVYKELKNIADSFEYGINDADGGWFDDNVETDLTQYSEAYKKFIDDVTTYNAKYEDSVKKAIDWAATVDTAFAEDIKNLTTYGEKLAVFWSNPDKYNDLAVWEMGKLYGSGAGSDDALNLSNSFLGFLNQKNEAMEELDQFIESTEKRLKEKGYDFSKELAPKQIGALLKMSKDWLEKHPEWENIYDVIADKLNKRWGIKIVPETTEVEENLPAWMEALQKELDGTGIELKADMSYEQIFDAMKKGYDTAQTAINKLGPLAFSVGLKLDNLTAESIAKFGNAGSKDYNPEVYAGLSELVNQLGIKNTIDTAGKKRGWDFGRLKKDGSSKKEKQSQEAAKAVREQMRIMKEAADAFQYWREKVGDDGAWAHVEAEFGDVLARIGITAKNVNDLRRNIEGLTPKINKIKDKKVRDETFKEQAKELAQLDRKDFERSAEEFASKVQVELDGLTRAWEIFNSVREATGNVELAVHISGVGRNGNRNLADDLKEKIQNDLASIKDGLTIDFDVNLSDEEIRRAIERAFNELKPVQGKNESDEAYMKRLAAYEDKIKGITEETKKWRDLERDALKTDIEVFDKLIGSAVDLQSRLKKITDEYQKQIQALDDLKKKGKIGESEYNQARAVADSNFRMNSVKAQDEYQFLMGGIVTMTKEAAKRIKNEFTSALESQLRSGAITAKEYADGIEEINKKMRDLEDAPNYFESYMRGGLSGVFENLYKQGKGNISQGASLYQQGSKLVDNYNNGIGGMQEYLKGLDMMSEGNKLESIGQGMQNAAGDMQGAISTIDMIIHGIDDMVQSLKGIFDDIRETLAAVGENTDTEAWNNWGTFFDTFSNASSNATKGWDSLKNGDIGGAIQGTIGSVTSWIKGVGNLTRKDTSAEVDAAIEASNKILSDIDDNVERISNEMKESYGVKAIENFSNLQMQNLNKIAELNGQIQNAGNGYYGRTHTEWYYRNLNGGEGRGGYVDRARALLGLEEGGYGTSWQGFFNQIATMGGRGAELLNILRKNAYTLGGEWADIWNQINNRGWDDEGRISDIANTWANLWDEMGEHYEEFLEQMAGTSLDDVFSEFMNGLYDIANGSEDVFDDIANNWKKMINKMVVNNIVAQGVKEKLEDWYKNVFAPWYSNGQGSTQDVYDQLDRIWEDAVAQTKAIESYLLPTTSDSGGGLSSSIKGITEQTADLLAAYINAIRADVSVIRALDTKAVQEYWPSQISLMTSANNNLVNIEQHTLAIMGSNESIAKFMESIDDRFFRLEKRVWSVPVA